MKMSKIISATDIKPYQKEGLNKITNFPAVNVSETKNNLHIVLEIPGYDHEDVSVFVIQSKIYVSGNRQENLKTKEKTTLTTERISSFCWVYDLKMKFTKNDVVITLENGFLFISVEKHNTEMIPVSHNPIVENYYEDNVYFPRANVVETEKYYEMSLEIPGYKTDDVSIEITDTSLIITGNRSLDLNYKGQKYHRVEIPFRNSFLRRFDLPENVNKTQSSWNVEKGVLYVYMPKLKAIRKEEVAKETMFA